MRSWRNHLAPISRIPPEIFVLVPDFWEVGNRDEDVIALTHVCQTWRELFVPRPSLWVDFDCMSMDKTIVYLERSGSSPINLWLDGRDNRSPQYPFLHVVPHVVNRLKSLDINGKPETLQDFTTHLTRPAPLLESLSIHGGCESDPDRNPLLTTTLFNGDLHSLRELCLLSVRTMLPWRNMVNLTSFTLGHMLPADVSISQLLDFFEASPHLRDVRLYAATPTSGAQDGRLVSLACLESMDIIGDKPPSLLLDHLIIPVGARLTTQAASRGDRLDDHLPRSLDNLRNLSDFTEIHLCITKFSPLIRISGPNGQISMIPITPFSNTTRLVLGSLARFNTSKAEWLKIDYGDSPSSDRPYRALLPMKELRALMLYECATPDAFTHALDPNMNPSGVVACPKLEGLILVLRQNRETLDIKSVIKMAEARASRGAKLRSVRIVTHDESMQTDALELREHVLHVECGPEDDDVANDGNYGGGEED